MTMGASGSLLIWLASSVAGDKIGPLSRGVTSITGRKARTRAAVRWSESVMARSAEIHVQAEEAFELPVKLSEIRDRIHRKSHEYFVFDFSRREGAKWRMFYGAT